MTISYKSLVNANSKGIVVESDRNPLVSDAYPKGTVWVNSKQLRYFISVDVESGKYIWLDHTGRNSSIEKINGYIFAGRDAGTIYADTDTYNPLTQTWVTKTDFPTPLRHSMIASNLNNKSYITTGALSLTAAAGSTATLEFNQDLNSFTTKTDITGGRQNSAAGTIGNYIYVAGGVNSTTLTNSNQEYSITDTWTTKTNVPTPTRAYHAGKAINKFYLMGGSNNSTTLYSDNDEYYPDTWTAKTDLVSPARMASTAASIETKIYLFNGRNNTTTLYQDTDEYNPTLNSWAAKTDTPTPARGEVSSLSTQFSANIIGGSNSVGTYYLNNYRYQVDTWIVDTDMSAPGRSFMASSEI